MGTSRAGRAHTPVCKAAATNARSAAHAPASGQSLAPPHLSRGYAGSWGQGAGLEAGAQEVHPLGFTPQLRCSVILGKLLHLSEARGLFSMMEITEL